VAITVEGPNFLTRNLIIFGQCAIRCHPYLLDEMQAAAIEDEEQAVPTLDKILFKHTAFICRGVGRV
jgi:acyl-CoA dehydrogenase